MNHLRISVVVTVLNEEKTIRALLESLRQQTYLPDEIIIVDGGSTDATWNILQSSKSTAGKPRLVLLQKEGNRSIGRNYGFQQARNEIVAVTDAGCFPFKNWLKELVVTYVEKQVRVVAGYYEGQAKTPFEQAVIPYALVMPDKVNPAAFLPATRSMFLDKKVWKEVGGFDESLSDNEDYAFAKQIKNNNIALAFTSKAIVTWFPRSDLKSFANMIYRFARGDVQAGIVRPKVVFIFIRYILFVIAATVLLALGQPLLVLAKVGIWLCIYSLWAIFKNIRYVPRGWYWLPVLQLVSDVEVMRGSLAGFKNSRKP